MTIDFGFVDAASTLYIPFNTFDSNGASITLTGLAVTDIEIYKNGSVTQRSSDAGYTLLDTDGIDFDGITGIHGFSVDLNDNTDAGFYSVGGFYWVVISAVTVDTRTVNFVAATFRIRTAQTAGDVVALINTLDDYVDSEVGAIKTKTDQLTFTVANQVDANAVAISGDATAADNFETMLDGTGGNSFEATIEGTVAGIAVGGIASTSFSAGAINAAAIADGAIDAATFAAGAITATVIADGAIDAATFAAGAITASVIAADAIGASELAADAVAEIADAIWDEARSGHSTAGTYGESFLGVVNATAITGTLSTTAFTTDLTEATDDHYNGRIVVWLTGVLVGQATDITDYTGATKLVTVTAMTEAPSNADRFVIV